MGLNLFEKTELWITNIKLNKADLNEIARVVAEVLKLKMENVLVVDVRDGHITLDILEENIDPKKIFGKKIELFNAIKNINGIQVTNETDFHSNGILGAIALDPWTANEIIESSQEFSRNMEKKIRNRVIVFSTGFEVKAGMIKDTNTSYVTEVFSAEGYQVRLGDILDDDIDSIAGGINSAIDKGYGLIITTGGVGAEDKDKTVEGVLKVDPNAATPYLVKFEKGMGRHVKDGVRIAVGQVEYSTIVSLPGPNDEVRIAISALLEGLRNQDNKMELSNRIAAALKDKYRSEHKVSHKQWKH